MPEVRQHDRTSDPCAFRISRSPSTKPKIDHMKRMFARGMFVGPRMLLPEIGVRWISESLTEIGVRCTMKGKMSQQMNQLCAKPVPTDETAGKRMLPNAIK